MKTASVLLAVCFFLPLAQNAFSEEAYEVTAKAWKAFADEDWDAAVELADKANKLWGSIAKKSNAALTDYPSEDEVKEYANLNELATITWIKVSPVPGKLGVAGPS